MKEDHGEYNIKVNRASAVFLRMLTYILLGFFITGVVNTLSAGNVMWTHTLNKAIGVAADIIDYCINCLPAL